MTQQLKPLAWFLGGAIASLVCVPALASIVSVGEAGIDALKLRNAPYNLTGAKIAIGQVEPGRPAQFGLDKAAVNNLVVNVTRLFYRDGRAQANTLVDEHASNVASVMISQEPAIIGVAPNARLYSSASGATEPAGQPAECLASQTVALQNGGDLRAINFSFGEPLRGSTVLDGNALLTQCIDWSASAHDVLYVIAGNQGEGGIPIPTDNYNGMTVANSALEKGVFARVASSDLGSRPLLIPQLIPRPEPIHRSPDLESNVGARRSVSLVAPGSNIEMINPDGRPTVATGTSFAAPHVTASVALIQEYGDRQIRNHQPHWSVDARRHEVSKVILMNSADKIKDTGDGLMLGMTRTVINARHLNWLQSDAYQDPKIPLNADLGTGHLNVFRAIQQFSPGQWAPDTSIPAIGWDYRSVGTGETPQYRDYVLEQPLQAGSYVSITLAWDRKVELQDTNKNGLYDMGETFKDDGLNNLDLYLLPADKDNIRDSVAASISDVDSVEHVFNQVPATGRYKIRVVYRTQVNEPVQPYAIAWWTVPAR